MPYNCRDCKQYFSVFQVNIIIFLKNYSMDFSWQDDALYIIKHIKIILFDIESRIDVRRGSSAPDLINWSITVGKTKLINPIITITEKANNIIG